MAIIYSYPLNNNIKLSDELVGTTEQTINGQLKTVTRNFLLQDLSEFFIVDGGLQRTITLTTNNASGPATLNQLTGVLNIPNYSTGSSFTPSALTKFNDTNVTLTLGGSPSNALLQGVSLTLGWTGTLADSRIASASVWNAKEPTLGNPTVNGYVLSSTTTGVRSWVAQTGSGGSQNLQQVTDEGATTDNTITINTVNADGLNINTSGSDITKSPITVTSTIPDATTFKSLSYNGALGNYLYADTGDCASLQTDDPFGIGLNVTSTGIGISAYSIDFPVVELYQALTNKGLTINSGTSSTGNFIELNKNGVDKLTINQQGELTATKLIKQGGTSSQFLMADGSTSTGGSGSAGGIKNTIASGTDTYTATISGVASYVDGDAYLVRFTNGNTTNATLNINGLGAIALYRNNDGALIGGDIQSGGEMLCVYNSTLNAFQCIGTSPNSIITYVTNADSVTITKGQAVYAFGGVGDRMTVKLAYNTGDSTSAQTVGIVMSSSIAPNQKGIVMTQGLLDGLNIFPIATFADGDTLYLGATAGTITNVKPYAPNHLVYLGVVTTASAGSAGRMYVKPQNGYELDEIHNVQAQNPTLKDTLWYDNSVSPAQWKTASIATILGYTPANDASVVHLAGTETITGVKTFSSNPKIPVNGGNSGVGALVIDNGTGQIEIATNYLYPNLLEIQNVKGVTSAIQTQFSGKQDKSLSAYKFVANNTSATANGTEQNFRNVTETNYTEIFSSSPVLTPPANSTHTYTWTQVGNLVTLRLNLAFAAAWGATLTTIICPWPTDANKPPNPVLPSGLSANEIVSYHAGALTTSRNAYTPVGTYAALRLKTVGTPNIFEIIISRTAAAYQYGYASIQYFV